MGQRCEHAAMQAGRAAIGHEDPAAEAEVDAWAASGAMAITGRRHAPPLGPPAGFVPKLQGLADRFAQLSGVLGRVVTVDPLALLSERAAIAGWARQGTMSCGGATRLVRARDGWLAVSLARADDIDLVPAWIERPGPITDVWEAVERYAAASIGREAVERGVLLGLPIARLPSPPAASAGPVLSPPPLPVTATAFSVPEEPRRSGLLRVVDLSALWAGPLCGSLLGAAGAEVIKVESTRRPDGARLGPAAFFDLMNGGKRSVALDLQDPSGVASLVELLRTADVVIESSRPRALEQLGISVEAVMAAGRVRVWTSITAHGRTGPAARRVGFGDDAAVAGGLVSWDAAGPCFCADAVADPLTGVVAAVATLDKLQAGGRWLLDVAMADVAAHLAGPTRAVRARTIAAPPRARSAEAVAPALGEHNGSVLGMSRTAAARGS